MKESNLPAKEGEEKVFYPRMIIERRVETDELVRTATDNTTYGRGEARGCIDMLVRGMAICMAQGASVYVEGLGTFTPALKLKRGVERETGTEGTRRRNARSIEMGGVHFRPDRELLREVERWCVLKRAVEKPGRSSTRYTEEERRALAIDFLQRRGEMSLAQYCALTGLLKDKASRELRRWEHEPEVSGIKGTGRGVAKRWVLAGPQS